MRIRKNIKHRNTSLITKSQSGLSLVELMIAMALGLIIILALTELFVDMSRTNSEMAKTNAQIENARFAIQILQEDIVHGGYWGGFTQFDDITLISGAPSDEPTDVEPTDLDPCLPFDDWDQPADALYASHRNALIGIPLQAFNTSVAPGNCGGVVANRLVDAGNANISDLLVVRHAETCVEGDPNCESEVAGRFYFQVSNCEEDVGSRYALDTISFPLRERICGATIAPKRRFIQNIYYIRDYAQDIGDGIPTLVRSQFDLSGGTLAHQNAVPLVEGIERFRVEFGVDDTSDSGESVDYDAAVLWADEDNWRSPRNRGDGFADKIIHCAAGCTAVELRDVVLVKIDLLARATEQSPGYTDTKTYTLGTSPAQILGPFNDNFKRHAFSTTIRLNNVAGRRETPSDPNEVIP